MSGSDTKGSGLSLLDTALVVAAVVGGIFVVLWLVHAVFGLVLFAFKIAILVVVVAVIVRIVHALHAEATEPPRRRRRGDMPLSAGGAPGRARCGPPPCVRSRSTPPPRHGSRPETAGPPGPGRRPWPSRPRTGSPSCRPRRLRAPRPSGNARTGVPHAMDSSMTIPKGSFHRMGKSKGAGLGQQLELVLVGDFTEIDGVGPEERGNLLVEVRPLPRLAHLRRQQDPHTGLAGHLDGAVCAFVRCHPAQEETELPVVVAGTVTEGEGGLRRARGGSPGRSGCRARPDAGRGRWRRWARAGRGPGRGR